MAKPLAMSSDFSSWYTDSFMDDGKTRDRRWKGVVDVSNNPSIKTIEVCLRLAFSTIVPAAGLKSEGLAEAYAAVISTISGGERAFDASQSTREIQVLAAAALSRMFEEKANAAIGVITASFSGTRKPDLPMDLVGLAKRALLKLSSREHLRVDPATLQTTPPKLDFSVSAAAMQSMDAVTWSAELMGLRDSAGTAIAAATAEYHRAASTLYRQMTLDQEELQILWWLVGGYSRHLEMPFNDIDREVRPLRIAQELGEMIKVSPGPTSIRALITRAGVGAENCTVEEAINAVDLAWAKKASESQYISPLTTPLHFALEKRAEQASDETWQPGWTGITGLRADLSMPAAQIAELFYHEYLFLYVGG